MTQWYEYFDMASGGSEKLAYRYIYIEAHDEDQADRIFEDLFDRDPKHETCPCCGADFSIMEYDSLDQATAYARGWKRFGSEQVSPLDEFLIRKDVKVIYFE